MGDACEDEYRRKSGERAAAARARLGVGIEWLAERVEVSAAAIEALEAGAPTPDGERVDLRNVAAQLLTSCEHLIGYEQDEPYRRLDLAGRAWMWRPQLHGALSVAREWMRYDSFLHRLASPRDDSWPDCLAARGIPEARERAFGRVDLPRLEPYTGTETAQWGPAYNRIRHLAAQVRATLALPGAVTGAKLADVLGVPVGLAPLGLDVRGVVVNPDGHPLVVLSSDFHTSVHDEVLLQLAVHLVLGDVVVAVADTVEDEDDDSIYHCAGAGWKACSLAHWVASELAEPGACDRDEAAMARVRTEGYTGWRPVPLEPVLADGEEPGYWHQIDVPAYPQPIRRALGVRHDHLVLPAGDGQTRWPLSLARRVVAGMNRGLVAPHRENLAKLGLDLPGGISMTEASDAVARYEQVRTQLEAWNDRKAADLIAEIPDNREAELAAADG